MGIKHTFELCAVVLVIGFAGACSNSDITTPSDPAGVPELRKALAPYASFALATADGYDAALTDCMSNGDAGAMGIHYGKPALIDGVLDPMHPEILIYEPGTAGQMSLVGVEFVVPFTVQPETSAPPTLFGQTFVPNQVFGLWTLHVWTHRANPSGLFSPWNPRVHC
jgi:hypothetical protein